MKQKVEVISDVRYKVKNQKGNSKSYRMQDMEGEVIEEYLNEDKSRVQFHIGSEVLVGDFDNKDLRFI